MLCAYDGLIALIHLEIWKKLIRQLIFHVGFIRKHKKLLYHLFSVLDVLRYWALWYMNEKVAMVICKKIHLVQKIWDDYFAMCFIPSWWVSLDKIHLLAGYIVWNVLHKSKIYFLVHENWMFQYGTVSVHLWWKSRFTKYMQIRGNYDMGYEYIMIEFNFSCVLFYHKLILIYYVGFIIYCIITVSFFKVLSYSACFCCLI